MILCSGFVFYELRPSRHLRLISAWIGWPSDASLSRVMEAVEQTSCGPPHVLYRFSGKARLLRDDLSRRLGHCQFGGQLYRRGYPPRDEQN